MIRCQEAGIIISTQLSIITHVISISSRHDVQILFFRHNYVFRDVYREVGLLEVFVTCLQRYANTLKLKEQAAENGNGKD